MFVWFDMTIDAMKVGTLMIEFFGALTDPDIPFLRYALIVGLLSSVAFGIVGTYVVTRRISYLAGAIAHSALGGIGIALFLQRTQEISWITPQIGALIAAILTALLVGWINLRAKEREDTAIGALWAIGMALGLIFLAKTPGYVDPMSYLFGNILFITQNDLITIAILDGLIISLALLFYRHFMAICFDEEFARLRGLPVEAFYLLLLSLTALTIVLLIQIVGIVMVIALLTLPAAVAGILSRTLWGMMIWATCFCAFFATTGLGVSYIHDLPTGPTIIMIAALVYVFLISFRKFMRGRD